MNIFGNSCDCVKMAGDLYSLNTTLCCVTYVIFIFLINLVGFNSKYFLWMSLFFLNGLLPLFNSHHWARGTPQWDFFILNILWMSYTIPSHILHRQDFSYMTL